MELEQSFARAVSSSWHQIFCWPTHYTSSLVSSDTQDRLVNWHLTPTEPSKSHQGDTSNSQISNSRHTSLSRLHRVGENKAQRTGKAEKNNSGSMQSNSTTYFRHKRNHRHSWFVSKGDSNTTTRMLTLQRWCQHYKRNVNAEKGDANTQKGTLTLQRGCYH